MDKFTGPNRPTPAQPQTEAVVPEVTGQPQEDPVLRIPRAPVHSTHLKSVGYEPDSGTLVVEFQDGEIYAYDAVDPQVAVELITAPSTGSYFQRHVANAFDYTRVR